MVSDSEGRTPIVARRIFTWNRVLSRDEVNIMRIFYLALKMEAVCSSEMLLCICKSALRYNSVDQQHMLRGLSYRVHSVVFQKAVISIEFHIVCMRWSSTQHARFVKSYISVGKPEWKTAWGWTGSAWGAEQASRVIYIKVK